VKYTDISSVHMYFTKSQNSRIVFRGICRLSLHSQRIQLTLFTRKSPSNSSFKFDELV